MELDIQPKSRVYLDANIFIYAIEDHESYRPHIAQLYQQLHERECQIVTSQLTYAECLVKPLEDQHEASIRTYENELLQSEVVRLIPINLDVLRQASIIRANSKTKLPDAIHMATAFESHCSYMVSNDRKLLSFDGIESIYLSEIDVHT